MFYTIKTTINFRLGDIPSSIGNIVEHQNHMQKRRNLVIRGGLVCRHRYWCFISRSSPNSVSAERSNGSFRWHTVDDVAQVDCRFVISSDFDILWCDTGRETIQRLNEQSLRQLLRLILECHPGILFDITFRYLNRKPRSVYSFWPFVLSGFKKADLCILPSDLTVHSVYSVNKKACVSTDVELYSETTFRRHVWALMLSCTARLHSEGMCEHWCWAVQRDYIQEDMEVAYANYHRFYQTDRTLINMSTF